EGNIAMVAKSGGATTVLVPSLAQPLALTVDATSIYFVDGVGVRSAPIGGGAPMNVWVGSANFSFEGIAVDSTHVYWTNSFDNTIRRGGLDGSMPTAMASQQTGTDLPIVVDDKSIYWLGQAGIRALTPK